jgi:hypothetical protein
VPGLSLAAAVVMRRDRGSANLEYAFEILRFRCRGLVTFRRFVVLHSDPIALPLRDDRAATQPLRVSRSPAPARTSAAR